MKSEMIIENNFGYADWEEYMVMDEDGEDTEDLDYIVISNLWVNRQHRGSGHGRELLVEACKKIRQEYGAAVTIKIVPEPKDDDVDLTRLASFYDSIDDIDEVVAV